MKNVVAIVMQILNVDYRRNLMEEDYENFSSYN